MKLFSFFFLVFLFWVPEVYGQSCQGIDIFQSAASGNDYGHSMDMDGDNFIVGAPSETINGVSHGCAYVYLKNGASWTEHKLTPSNGANDDFFGYDVGISGDTVIVGAYGVDGNNNRDGAAYVFTFDGTTWTETIITNSSTVADARFGYAVDISNSTALIGAPYDNIGGVNGGAGYIYQLQSGSWVETGVVGQGVVDEFWGYYVAVDGDYAVIGHDGGDINNPLDYIALSKVGNTWSTSGAFYLDEEDMGPVDVDNGRLVVSGEGRAYVICQVSCGLQELSATIIPSNNSFGRSVSISDSVVIVGAPTDSDAGNNVGAIYRFELDSNGDWLETGKFFRTSNVGGGRFGSATAVSGDYFIGATDNSSGAAFLFNCDLLPNDLFVTFWETTSDNESITIPTTGGGYNYTVDWGDGNTDVNVTGDATHIYAQSGTHQVIISGQFPRIYFNGEGDKDKITSVANWGINQWTSMSNAFKGCSQLDITAIDAPDLAQVENMINAFRDCPSLDSDLDHWDVSNVERMEFLFRGATSFNSPLSNWDVSNATQMDGMFQDAESFNQRIVQWNTENVTDMNSMFEGASIYNQSMLAFKTSKVTNMNAMFKNSGFHQDVSRWDYSMVTDLDDFLHGTSTYFYEDLLERLLQEPNLNDDLHLDAGNSTYCYTEDLKTSLSNNFNWTFEDGGATCGFKTTWTLFAGGTDFVSIVGDEETFNYTVTWGDGQSDSNVTGSIRHTYANGGNYQIEITGDFPSFFLSSNTATRLRSIDQWGNNQWATMKSAFLNGRNVTLKASDVPDLSEVTSMARMFEKCSKINTGNFNDWDVSNITNFERMFYSANVFNGDISDWNLISASTTKGMFKEAHDFNSDITDWDVSNVTNFEEMFLSSAFDQDIGDWDVSSGTTFDEMFFSSPFNQDIGDWDISSAVTVRSMFRGSFDQDISRWDFSNVKQATFMFDNFMSMDNYNKLLNSLYCRGDLNTNVNFVSRAYCDGDPARQGLIDSLGWNFFDTGQSIDCNLTPIDVTWTGTENTEWCDSDNWDSHTIPRSMDNVMIPLGAEFYPVIKGLQNILLNELNVSQGASMDVEVGSIFDAIRDD